MANIAGRLQPFRSWPVPMAAKHCLIRTPLFNLLSVALALSLGIAPYQAIAVVWSTTPSLSLSETYTDNVTLAPRGQEKEEYITEVAPGLSVRGLGQRLDLLLDYRLQHLIYARDSNRNNTFHQLQADSTTNIVSDFLFLGAGGTISQELAQAENLVTSNLTVSDARADVSTVYVAPFIRHAFSDFATSEVRYQFSNIEFDTNTADLDSQIHSTSATLENGARFSRFTWALDALNEKTDFDDGNDSTFRRITADLRYRILPSLRVLANGGYEDNDFRTGPSVDNPTDAFWSVGLSWEPTRRTTVEGTVGERFFGESFSARISHRGVQSVLTVEYAEEAVTSSQLALQDRPFTVTDPFDDPLDVGEVSSGGPSTPSISSETFVDKGLDATYTTRLRKSTIEIQGFSRRRIFQITGATERTYGGGGSWEWRFGARTRSLIGGQVEKRELRAQKGTLSQASVALIRDFGRRTTGILEYEYFRNDVDSGIQNEFRENVVRLQANITF